VKISTQKAWLLIKPGFFASGAIASANSNIRGFSCMAF